MLVIECSRRIHMLERSIGHSVTVNYVITNPVNYNKQLAMTVSTTELVYPILGGEKRSVSRRPSHP